MLRSRDDRTPLVFFTNAKESDCGGFQALNDAIYVVSFKTA